MMKFRVKFYRYDDGYEDAQPTDDQRAVLARFDAFTETERYMTTEQWGGAAGAMYGRTPPVPMISTKVDEVVLPDGTVETKYRRERNPEYVAWFADFLANGEDHEFRESTMIGNMHCVGEYTRRIQAERELTCVELPTIEDLQAFCKSMGSYEIDFEPPTIAVTVD
jgi:hypothetical protein